jgi:hypothetical protein
VKAELQKIADMYTALKALKLTITRTSTLQIPDSIQDTANKLDLVYAQLGCTLNYLDYFCDNTSTKPSNADINAQDKSVIDAATGALNTFKAMIENKASINNAGNNTQVANLANAVNRFSALKTRMTGAVTCLNTALNLL